MGQRLEQRGCSGSPGIYLLRKSNYPLVSGGSYSWPLKSMGLVATPLGTTLEVPWWVRGWSREVTVDVQAFICLEFSITPSYLEPVTPWYGSPGTNKIKKSGL